MNIEQTITSTSVNFPTSCQTCPHCHSKIEQKTNDVAIQILLVQLMERQNKLELENEQARIRENQARLREEELKKRLSESKKIGLENQQIMLENSRIMKEQDEKLNYLKAQKVK